MRNRWLRNRNRRSNQKAVIILKFRLGVQGPADFAWNMPNEFHCLTSIDYIHKTFDLIAVILSFAGMVTALIQGV